MKDRIKKLTPEEFERKANALARSEITIYACQKCGHPVIDGYICETCGDSNPSEPINGGD